MIFLNRRWYLFYLLHLISMLLRYHHSSPLSPGDILIRNNSFLLEAYRLRITTLSRRYRCHLTVSSQIHMNNKVGQGPTSRSFSQTDCRFFRRAVPKELRSVDGPTPDARRGRMRWWRSAHAVIQCLQNIERPTASSDVLSASGLDREWLLHTLASAVVRSADRKGGRVHMHLTG